MTNPAYIQSKIEKEEIESMLELLEQNDDVQNVFHNFKVV